MLCCRRQGNYAFNARVSCVQCRSIFSPDQSNNKFVIKSSSFPFSTSKTRLAFSRAFDFYNNYIVYYLLFFFSLKKITIFPKKKFFFSLCEGPCIYTKLKSFPFPHNTTKYLFSFYQWNQFNCARYFQLFSKHLFSGIQVVLWFTWNYVLLKAVHKNTETSLQGMKNHKYWCFLFVQRTQIL